MKTHIKSQLNKKSQFVEFNSLTGGKAVQHTEKHSLQGGLEMLIKCYGDLELEDFFLAIMQS